MKVRTSARPYPFILNLAFALFCLGGAAWGAYDYWVAYPAIQRANDELAAAKETLAQLGAAAAAQEAPGRPSGAAPSVGGDAAQPAAEIPASSLSDEDRRRYDEATDTIRRITAQYGGEPKQLAAWDRPLQLWLWVIGCGVLGFPFFLWPMIRMIRRRWELDEAGTLRTPWETIPLDQVTGIDMHRWCAPTGSKRSTWKAWLLTNDGKRHELDDHDYLNMHLIIGFYANRFHPEEWTAEAKRVGAPVDEDGGAAPADSAEAVDAAPSERADAT